MVKTKIKRAVSFVMATVLSLSAFMSIGTSTAFAARRLMRTEKHWEVL